MGKEIERKFLVADDSYLSMAGSSRHIMQAYLSTNPDATVRLRVLDDEAFITVKSRNKGCERGEWEYRVPSADVAEMLEACKIDQVIDKTRHYVDYHGNCWEVDQFHGRLDGLVLAEIELPSADCHFDIPPFAGREVTGDPRYYNSNLINGSFIKGELD